MKWKKEFKQHLQDNMNVGFIAINSALSSWQGSPFEDREPAIGKAEVSHKNPIELVNAKYPDGWYCKRFDEVVNDVISSLPHHLKKIYVYSEYKY
jgi:hypothetical protein